METIERPLLQKLIAELQTQDDWALEYFLRMIEGAKEEKVKPEGLEEPGDNVVPLARPSVAEIKT